MVLSSSYVRPSQRLHWSTTLVEGPGATNLINQGIALPAAGGRCCTPADAGSHWRIRVQGRATISPLQFEASKCVGEPVHGPPPLLVDPKAGKVSGGAGGYAPSVPLTRDSGPWTVTIGTSGGSQTNALTCQPKLLLPMSLNEVVNRRPERVQANV